MKIHRSGETEVTVKMSFKEALIVLAGVKDVAQMIRYESGEVAAEINVMFDRMKRAFEEACNEPVKVEEELGTKTNEAWPPNQFDPREEARK